MPLDDDLLWRHARSLLDTADGLEILGLGVFRGDRFEPRPAPAPTGYDAPRLIVKVADDAGASDDDIRARLRAALKQALDSASEDHRPAPLGGLGLIAREGGALRFHRSRRQQPAAAGAVDSILGAWRGGAPTLDERVALLLEAMKLVEGALSPADQARLLDELDYDLDGDDWARFGARIIAALPF